MALKFTLMQEVHILSDTFNLGAPVGETGIVVRIDRHVDQAQPYCVRVPSKKEWYWLPECDLEDASKWAADAAESVIHTSLLNHALDTRDKMTFNELCQRRVKP